MALEAIKRQEQGEIHWVSDGTYSRGDIVQIGSVNWAGIVQEDCVSGDSVVLAVEGVYECACASGTTFNMGAACEWDNSGKLVVAAAGGTFDLGRVARAKVSGETTVLVALNKT